MTLTLLLIVALGLSVDSFAVSLGLGAACRKINKQTLRFALLVGLLHTLFTVAGVLAFDLTRSYIDGCNEIIASALFAILAAKMIYDGIKIPANSSEDCGFFNLSLRKTLVLAFATSLDALILGAAIANTTCKFGDVGRSAEISIIAITIGVVTLLMTLGGIVLGRTIGKMIGRWAVLFGGLILLGMAIKLIFDFYSTN